MDHQSRPKLISGGREARAHVCHSGRREWRSKHGSALCKQSEDVEQDLRHEVAPSVEVVERAVPVESDGNLLCVGHLWGRGDMAPW